jgi:divalent metal cation (Fe/Co/Zn/Cd) transporter
MTITVTPRERLRQRARYLAYLTIAWNTVEAFVAIGSGIVAGSIALIGFGLDSTIEVFAASVALWFLRSHHDREERALRLIAISYFALAGYVTVEALRDLVVDTEAATSKIGIALAVASVIVMPVLALVKHRTGTELDSPALIAEAGETRLCAYLSVILLAGLALNATVGWWWADPIAAVGIAALAAREGRAIWSGDTCCLPTAIDDCCDVPRDGTAHG